MAEEELQREREQWRHHHIERGREEARTRAAALEQLESKEGCGDADTGALGGTFITDAGAHDPGNHARRAPPPIHTGTPFSVGEKSPAMMPRPETVPAEAGAGARGFLAPTPSPLGLPGQRQWMRVAVDGDVELRRPHTSMGVISEAARGSAHLGQHDPSASLAPAGVSATEGSLDAAGAAGAGCADEADGCNHEDHPSSSRHKGGSRRHLAHAIYTQRRAVNAHINQRLDKLFLRFAGQVGGAVGAKQDHHGGVRSSEGAGAAHAQGGGGADGAGKETGVGDRASFTNGRGPAAVQPHAMPGGVDCGEEEDEADEPKPKHSLMLKEKSARMDTLLKARAAKEKKEEERRKWREARRQAEARAGVTFPAFLKMTLNANVTRLSRHQLASIFLRARASTSALPTASLQIGGGGGGGGGAGGAEGRGDGGTPKSGAISSAHRPHTALSRRRSAESAPGAGGSGGGGGGERASGERELVEELLADLFLQQQGSGAGEGKGVREAILEAEEFRCALFLMARACNKSSAFGRRVMRKGGGQREREGEGVKERRRRRGGEKERGREGEREKGRGERG